MSHASRLCKNLNGDMRVLTYCGMTIFFFAVAAARKKQEKKKKLRLNLSENCDSIK